MGNRTVLRKGTALGLIMLYLYFLQLLMKPPGCCVICIIIMRPEKLYLIVGPRNTSWFFDECEVFIALWSCFKVALSCWLISPVSRLWDGGVVPLPPMLFPIPYSFQELVQIPEKCKRIELILGRPWERQAHAEYMLWLRSTAKKAVELWGSAPRKQNMKGIAPLYDRRRNDLSICWREKHSELEVVLHQTILPNEAVPTQCDDWYNGCWKQRWKSRDEGAMLERSGYCQNDESTEG